MSARSGLLAVFAALSVVSLVAISAVLADQGAPAKAAARGGPQPSVAAMRVTAPPLPLMGFAPGRPIDIARAAYDFAAQHPEVLKYVPCYCGCENEGHGDNESCFVKRRDARGNVLAWDMHGYGWTVCIDVARDAMQLYSSGADVVSIRSAIEKKWTPKYPTKTPTPAPPKK